MNYNPIQRMNPNFNSNFSSNLQQTLINDSFNYDSSIQPFHLKPMFSITCLFCTSINTQSISQDGSLRQCLNCRNQFQAQIQPANNLQHMPSLAPIKPVTTFQVLQRPIFIDPNPQQTQQQNQNQQQNQIQYQRPPASQNHYDPFFSQFNVYK